ncbi:MAG: ATP-binding protein [Ilumatobacter sp.]|uniref:ATP-binding protein n=1 Tax=Ilumatobacter sp. TaxID=1967498 RepID=UPI003C71B180
MQTTELDAETVVDLNTSMEQIGPVGLLLFDAAVSRGLSREIAGDLRLVTAELATNACEHGNAPEVSIRLSIDRAGALLSMAYVDSGIAPDPNDAVMPPPTSSRGRGLALVSALSSTVVRSVIHGVTVTTATFDRTVDPSG